MGDPINPLVIVPGPTCTTCWGIGKAFVLPTPKFVTMSFHDWDEGPLWNEDYRSELSSPVILQNSAPIPCFFGGISEHFVWWWESVAGQTHLNIKLKAPAIAWAMRAIAPPDCQRMMDNTLAFPFLRVTENGYASIIAGS